MKIGRSCSYKQKKYEHSLQKFIDFERETVLEYPFQFKNEHLTLCNYDKL